MKILWKLFSFSTIKIFRIFWRVIKLKHENFTNSMNISSSIIEQTRFNKCTYMNFLLDIDIFITNWSSYYPSSLWDGILAIILCPLLNLRHKHSVLFQTLVQNGKFSSFIACSIQWNERANLRTRIEIDTMFSYIVS